MCNKPAVCSNPPKEVYKSGAWCWFSDPRAIYTSSNYLIVGSVTNKGEIVVSSYELDSGIIKGEILCNILKTDDHNNPAFLVLPDENILTMYTEHCGRGLFFHKTTAAGTIESFEGPWLLVAGPDEQDVIHRNENFTYANLFSLFQEDNRIYCFGRWSNFKPSFITSDDGGESWTSPVMIVDSKKFDPNNRPYVKYFSDGSSKIHLAFTNGHPNVEPLNSIYYCYYEDGCFWRADHSKICSVNNLPFYCTDATLVYNATPDSGRSWIFDLTVDDGNPAILYTRYPSDLRHLYYYASFDGLNWNHLEIADSGGWFPHTQPNTTETEKYYSGGLVFDPVMPKDIYLSHKVNNIFEITMVRISESKKNFNTVPITTNSLLNNVRPFAPRPVRSTQKRVLLWMQVEDYIHFTNFESTILLKELN